MNKNRIMDHPVLGKLENQTEINFTFNGTSYIGFEGDTIASALLANGIRELRVHEETGAPRAIYCNIGHCFECRLTVDETPGIRACMTEIQADMIIESGKIQAAPLKPMEGSNDFPRTYTEFEQQSKANKGDDPHA